MANYQKNKVENLEQRIDQLEMFIGTLEEQAKFMKEIVVSQNDLIKYMAEQNTINLDKLAAYQQTVSPQQKESKESKDHKDLDNLTKKKDNEVHEFFPSNKSDKESSKGTDKIINRRII